MENHIDNTITYDEALKKAEASLYRSERSKMGLYCEKMWIEKRRTILMVCGAYLGFFLLFGFMVGATGEAPGTLQTYSYLFISGLMGAFVASEMFYDMVKKKSRIAVLMTPVSPADQFVARLLAVTAGFLLLAFAGYWVCQAGSILSFRLFIGEWADFYNPIRMFGTSYSYGEIDPITVAYGIFAFLSNYSLNTSVFVFGSVAWPRLSFLKTIFLMALIGILMMIAMVILLIADLGRSISYLIDHSPIAYWGIPVVMMVAAIAITCCAYRLFKRKTLLQKL